MAASSLFRLGAIVESVQLSKPYVRVVRGADGKYSFQDIVDRFQQANPGITVKLLPSPTTDRDAYAKQLLASGQRQAVVAGAAPVRRSLPLCRNQFALKKTLQCRVERAIVDQKLALGLLLQELGDTVGVVGLEFKAPENQHFESSLKQFEPVVLR